MLRTSIPAVLTMLAALLPFGASAQQATQAPQPPALALTTSAWPDGGAIPFKYTGAAENGTPVSPPLEWTNVPEGTVSFVLLMHDPDVSRNKTTEDNLHWLVWNIPGTVTRLAENLPQGELADGTRQTNNNAQAYGPPGARASNPRHHYTFELYALDTKLDVPAGSPGPEARAKVMAAMNGHVIGKAVYVGLFRRPQ